MTNRSTGSGRRDSFIALYTAALVAPESVGAGRVVSTQPWYEATLIRILAGVGWVAGGEEARKALAQMTRQQVMAQSVVTTGAATTVVYRYRCTWSGGRVSLVPSITGAQEGTMQGGAGSHWATLSIRTRTEARHIRRG